MAAAGIGYRGVSSADRIRMGARRRRDRRPDPRSSQAVDRSALQAGLRAVRAPRTGRRRIQAVPQRVAAEEDRSRCLHCRAPHPRTMRHRGLYKAASSTGGPRRSQSRASGRGGVPSLLVAHVRVCSARRTAVWPGTPAVMDPAGRLRHSDLPANTDIDSRPSGAALLCYARGPGFGTATSLRLCVGFRRLVV